MITKIETITPEKAKSYLAHNKHNRNVSQSLVGRMATAIRQKQWVVTHQGIAFDADGNLIDGQHRLNAIILANKSVEMLVTRGIPPVYQNGVLIKTMDVVDTGKKRTTAEQLFLSHDVANANIVTACLTIIVRIAIGGKVVLGVPQAVGLLELYGKHLDVLIPLVSKLRAARNCGVAGALAFGRHVHRDTADIFAEQIGTGIDLKRGDPALTLRNRLINGKEGSSVNDRMLIANNTMNSFYHFVRNNELTVLKQSSEGIDYFRSKQKANVAKIAEIMGFSLNGTAA